MSMEELPEIGKKCYIDFGKVGRMEVKYSSGEKSWSLTKEEVDILCSLTEEEQKELQEWIKQRRKANVNRG